MRCGDFKASYIKDEQIFQSLFVKFWLALFFMLLLIIPLICDAYVLYIANLIGFAIVGAAGLNILTGFTGQISLGHAAFVGVGGYTTAILMTKLNFSLFYAGVAGALWVSFMRIVTPDHFPFHLSIQYLAMIIVGGLGSVLGSIFGAIFMIMTPEMLNVLSSALSQMIPGMGQLFIPMKEVVFGALIVLFLIFEPLGLAEIWRRIKAFFLLWPFSY